ncbi:MAG: sigma-70 family RNA polymerase sigma factor [Clostridia bacterium]|nr:sigma-70 family RNA polymerase sigma factor [Clostridia bacterium]
MKETKNYAELVMQAVNGDNAAFEELYRATAKIAYRTANLILSNPSDADDVLQNAYIKAAEKLSELKKPESFESWLKSIVENECKNYIRKEKRLIAPIVLLNRKAEETSKEIAEPVPQEIMEREDLRNSVTEILNTLSPETRACIVLFHYEDKSLNEISEILNIPVGTVKSRLHNGRKKIEKQFEKLRKKDPTLYSIGAIPVLLSVLTNQAQNITLPAAMSSAAAITAGSAIGATASTTAGATAATAAATTGTTISAAAATATTTTAIVAKAAAVIVAGSLAVGGTAVIKKQIEKQSEQTIEYSVESEEVVTGATTQSYSAESLSEESNTESSTVQSTSSIHPTSQVVTQIASSNSNLTTAFTESQAKQTTATTTQKPPETTSYPTTQAPTTVVTQPQTQSTTQLATEATTQSITQLTTQPPTTNPENNYSSASGVITEYNGSNKSVSIPSTIGGNTVTAIGVGAFQGNTNISSVSLPDTVTQIGQEAFADCTSLSTISLPSSLKQIGIGAFYGCSNLSSINVPDSVTTISDEAFANCTALKTITIPPSVTNIADDAFSGCDSLTIICSEGSTAHKFAINNSIEYTITN